jgi:hypothetical protein
VSFRSPQRASACPVGEFILVSPCFTYPCLTLFIYRTLRRLRRRTTSPSFRTRTTSPSAPPPAPPPAAPIDKAIIPQPAPQIDGDDAPALERDAVDSEVEEPPRPTHKRIRDEIETDIDLERELRSLAFRERRVNIQTRELLLERDPQRVVDNERRERDMTYRERDMTLRERDIKIRKLEAKLAYFNGLDGSSDI